MQVQAKQNSLLIFLPGLFGLCHHPGFGATSSQGSQGCRQPLLLCPLCSLANHHSPHPTVPHSSAASPGVPGGVPGVPGVGWGTYSRGLVEPRQGSPPARHHLLFSVVPVVSPHPSPAALQRAEIAPKHVLPSGEQCQGPGSPGHCLLPGAPAGPGSTIGSSLALCRGTGWL